MADRQGIEIDYCPTCRGVWLDRGELDKIIERSSPTRSEVRDAREVYEPIKDPRDKPDHGRYYDEDRADYQRHRGGKRKSFLGDLFDF